MFPDPTGWAPQQLLNGFWPSVNSSDLGYYNPDDAGLLASDPTGSSYSTYSSYNPITLPQQYWPSQDQYDRTAAQMQSYGITPPPRGTLDPKATSALGQSLYDQPSMYDSPFLPALVMMGGAALGGGFANGGAGFGAGATAGSGSATVTGAPIVSAGAAAPAYGGAAATFPMAAADGAITATPIAGAGFGAGAGAGAAAASGLGLGGWLTVGALGAQALQGNKDIVTNSSNAPPAYLQPYLSGAAGDASTLYGQGNYVSPVQHAAIDYGTNVLSGNYLNSNPYLDATFNKAAGAVTNQVQSNFGLSGRNARGIDAAGFAQDGYNNLATQIYGGNYQAERDRMQQLVPLAGQLGSYTNPGASLDDYIARLRNLGGGYGSSTSSTPTESNWLSGLAGLGLALMP